MAQSALEQLKEQNKLLKEELQTLRELFHNLSEERHLESSDQRRAFMLKAQNYQLERQCMLLSQAQSNRASVLTEIECQLQRFCSDFQEIIAAEKSGPNVTVKRSQIMEILGNMRKLKNSLYKQSQLESSAGFQVQSLMSGSKYAKDCKPLNCLDVCKPYEEKVNLKHVASLEQELSSLYKRLCSFHSSLDASVIGDKLSPGISRTELSFAQKYFSNPMLEKLRRESEECIEDLKHCCDQLVALSLLHPSAPWVAVRKPDGFDTIKFENVMQSLPQNAQKNSRVRTAVHDTCKAHNYMVHMQKLKMDAMQVQLQSHQAVAKTQQQYLTELSTVLLNNFNAWKEETVDGICRPIAGALQSWVTLKDDQSSENLKIFLADFKKCESELEKVSMLEPLGSMSSKDELFSQLTERLHKSLQIVETDYIHKLAQAEESLSRLDQSR